MYQRPESVLVVVYTVRGEVLLLRRCDPADFWQSVTGSLQWDETPAQAAARELAEETGMTAVVIEDCAQSHRYPILPAWRARFDPAVRENLEHVFRVRVPAPCAVHLDAREHTAFRWMQRNEALRWVSSSTNRTAILELPAPYNVATLPNEG